jgi:GTP-binding protein LepA
MIIFTKATIITPDEFLGSIIKLCQDKRGLKLDLSYSGNRAVLNYELPLNEVVFDFNDRLKSVSSGYASFDYEISSYKESDLVKMSILVNSEPVDALSMIIFTKATIITPDEFLGSIIKLCQDKRGLKLDLSYSGNRAVLNYELPLNEVVFDFNDRLKSVSSGYASFDYEISSYKESDLVKMSILVNSEPVDALSMIIFTNFAQSQGRLVCEKLKELIPRHNFQIPIQAAIGGKIIARETINYFKKDVLTKIHGGGARDRKRKLLDKQKKGKSRAKQFGSVEIPQEAFIGVLKINKDS